MNLEFNEFNNPDLKERRRILRKNQTESEKRLWLHLRMHRLRDRRFLRQFGIGPYIVDFYCPAKRVAIEIDGGHHQEEETKAYDQERTAYLESKSIKVLRFWNDEVLKNTEAVVEKIMREVG